jgi:hypothetical protein
MTRRIVATTFASGPGYEVFLDELKIGAIGKHFRERNWWWQITPKLDPATKTVRKLIRSRKPVGRRRHAAGMQETKPKALAALFAKYNELLGKARENAALRFEQGERKMRRVLSPPEKRS